MRVEKSGNNNFAFVRDFLRSALTEKIVMLRAPNKPDSKDYACPRETQAVRPVRHIAPDGSVRVLMTNCLDMQLFPAACFSDLYHQRGGIEEAFKRLKHRLNLEHVSGLSQQAVVQDVAAKILCDNLQALRLQGRPRGCRSASISSYQSRLRPHRTQATTASLATGKESRQVAP
jgi:hypothetical protein